MNYFVEGLQGSGKSTLVKRLADRYKDHTVFHEGDYCPVELAWCTWMDEDSYKKALEKYPSIQKEIEDKTVTEGTHKVMRYTQILTDIPGFHKDMEQYEIYNGRIPLNEFEELVLKRFSDYNGTNGIFECSVFQNIVEDMILFRCMSDEEITAFYAKVKEALSGKDYRILYLESEDIRKNIDHIRKERSDDKGNELWFPMMLEYFNSCPYSVENKKAGEDDLIEHFCHRQSLELKLCNELFKDKAVVLKSKSEEIENYFR
ncbi:MAG: deoxynucleoside kinase [Lachnospiraceae bacterium]|nr:deoxynucleoside kinase [Lachnospiraceae bacterium]